jgi:membrane protein
MVRAKAAKICQDLLIGIHFALIAAGSYVPQSDGWLGAWVKARELVGLTKDTFQAWSDDKASRLGASVAYYAVFSLAPILVVVIAVAGFVFGEKAVRGEVVGQIQGLVGNDGAQLVQTMIASASKPSSGIIATVIAVATLLLGATGLFGELQDSLNTVWEIAPKPRGILATIRVRLISFGMVLGIAFLLLVALVVSAAVAAIAQFIGNTLPMSERILEGLDFVISFGFVTLMFAAIYKALPDAEISWRDVWPGAAVTSLLFTIGKLAIGLYLGHGSTTSTYGAAGSLVVVLLWVYYAAQIFFFGAEFTKVYANRYGSHVKPKANAMTLAEQLQSRHLRPDKETTRKPLTAPTSPDEPTATVERFRQVASFQPASMDEPRSPVSIVERIRRQSYVAYAMALVVRLGVALVRVVRGRIDRPRAGLA